MVAGLLFPDRARKDQVRGDDPDLASYLPIEERNWRRAIRRIDAWTRAAPGLFRIVPTASRRAEVQGPACVGSPPSIDTTQVVPLGS